MYRPPQRDTDIFNKAVREVVGKVKVKNNTEVYLIGVININFGNKRFQMVRDLESNLKAHGLKQLIKEHTRLSTTSRDQSWI